MTTVKTPPILVTVHRRGGHTFVLRWRRDQRLLAYLAIDRWYHAGILPPFGFGYLLAHIAETPAGEGEA